MSNITGFAAGVTGVDDGDVLIELDVGSSNTFHLLSTAGAMEVFVSLDGTNYSTAPLGLTDQGATTSDPVLATVANRVYGFRGVYRKVRVVQTGATAVTAPYLSYGQM